MSELFIWRRSFLSAFLAFLFCFVQVNAQEQKDLMEVGFKLLGLKKETKDSLAENSKKALQFSALPAVGYAMHTGWAAAVSANGAFYTDTANNGVQKISSITTNVTYSQFKQLMMPFQGNIWTKGNRFNVLIDYRYIKYPSRIFGIGDGTKSTDGYLVDFHGLKLHQALLKSIAPNVYAGLGFFHDRFWDIAEVDPPAGITTPYQQYSLIKKENATGPTLHFLYDSRLNTINPQGGMQANLVFRRNTTFFGSTSNWTSLLVEFRKYIPFPGNAKNRLAIWSYNWFTLDGKPPFLMLPSTGWDYLYNSGRGYIQGRFRDRNMLYLETEYRFSLTGNGLIGGVVFLNGQCFSSQISKGYGSLIPGYGMGLRIKLNKHSGANLCIDYGFGRDGSRGFAVNLGEVF